MNIFKLMYLKKKGKLDNKGAALANVLLITTFVMVLSSSIMSMAYSSYRMKLVNLNSKDNFYSCEAILDQIKTGLQNELAQSTESTDEDKFKEIYSKYKLTGNYAFSGVISAEAPQGFYDLAKIATFVKTVDGQKVTPYVTENQTPKNVSEESTKISYSYSYVLKVDDTTSVTLSSNEQTTYNFEQDSTHVSFKNLTVTYTEDGYESRITTDIKIELGTSGSTTILTGSGKGGWKTMLENRVKSYTGWQQAFLTEEYKNNDFGTEVPMGGEAVYVNTTDYPANSVSDIIFEMERYYGTYSSPIYPWVQVQDGKGTGTQYAACEKGNFSNVQVYIGGNEEEDSSWVAYTDVFDSNYFVKTTGRGDASSAVAKYIAYYGDTYTSAADVDGNQYVVKYRVKLIDTSGGLNSRGYILVTGGVAGDSGSTVIKPYKASGETYYVRIYVDIKDEYTLPEIQTTSGNGWNGYNYGYIYMDLSDTGYCVGDILKITLSNVDPKTVMSNYFSISMQVQSTYGNQYASIGSLTYGKDYTVEYEEGATSMDIYVTMAWKTYPYFKIYYFGALSTGDVEAGVDTSWVSTTGGKTENVITSPSSGTQISYQNWRKE